jgi:hypothetical protein
LPARKTLRELVAGGTFRPTRHARLLLDEELGSPPAHVDPDAWRELGHFATDYRTATGTLERKVILDAFVHRSHSLLSVERPRLTLEQELCLRIGLSPRGHDTDPVVSRAIARRWHGWMREHGDDWEAGRPCPPPPALKRDDQLKITAADRKAPKGGPVVVVGLGGPTLRGAAARRYLERHPRKSGLTD